MTVLQQGTFDQDGLVASLDLVQRTGVRSIEFGYLHDDVPVAEASWWATADYRGAKVMVEQHVGPVEAVEALARRLFAGATCRRCGKLIALADDVEGCRWRRMGAKWEPGCGLPINFSIPSAPR